MLRHVWVWHWVPSYVCRLITGWFEEGPWLRFDAWFLKLGNTLTHNTVMSMLLCWLLELFQCCELDKRDLIQQRGHCQCDNNWNQQKLLHLNRTHRFEWLHTLMGREWQDPGKEDQPFLWLSGFLLSLSYREMCVWMELFSCGLSKISSCCLLNVFLSWLMKKLIVCNSCHIHFKVYFYCLNVLTVQKEAVSSCFIPWVLIWTFIGVESEPYER